MRFNLLPGSENDSNIYSLSVSNREGIRRKTPSRAFRKVPGVINDQYFSEVLVPISSDDLPGEDSYQEFDKRIEQRIKKKEVEGNINVFSFFGDKEVDPQKVANFEDIGLLSKFEVLFNDHLIGMPYSFKFYREGAFEEIFKESTKIYETFSSVLDGKNLLGYIPAYVSYNDLEKYVNFYSGKAKEQVISEGGEKLNAIPLMIDFKRANPDGYMRSIAKLLELKRKYITEGYYPIYYAYNVSRPRMSKNKKRDLAKEFLLSFLGFDIIGASNAVLPGGGGSNTNKRVDFDLAEFVYDYTNQNISSYNSNKLKASIYGEQSRYLGNIHEKSTEDIKYVRKELTTRKEATEYLNTITPSGN